MTRILAMVLAVAVAASGCTMRSPAAGSSSTFSRGAPPQAAADNQTTIDAWRAFVVKLPPGARINVTLKNGRRIRATLLQSTDAALVISPRTRIPEPVMTVGFAELASLDLEQEGSSPARAIGIGIAAGAGVFLTVLLILAASLD